MKSDVTGASLCREGLKQLDFSKRVSRKLQFCTNNLCRRLDSFNKDTVNLHYIMEISGPVPRHS